MRRFGSARLLCTLPILFALLHGCCGDVTIASYAITDPSDPNDITYNRATDTTIIFTVTVNQGTGDKDVDEIDVYFADTSGNKLGTEQGASGANIPKTITDGSGTEDIADNTVDLKFENEPDCTAADKLCVLIKGSGVDDTSAEYCLDLGTGTDEAGGKDCTDPPTTAAPADPTSETATTDADATTGEGESGAGAAYLMWSVLSILLLATRTLTAN